MSAEAPTITDIRAAARRIAGLAIRTPLLTSPALDEATGGRILLKCEGLQRTGSFKFRGACNAIAALDGAERRKGVVAVSSGNHAQGIAEAARLFGVRATVVMPADAPVTKRARTERSGARVIPYDRATEDRDAIAARLLAEEGGTLVHPFNDARVIAGQGTIGLEIAEQTAAIGATPDLVVIPCSGGGLTAGIGVAIRDTFPAAGIAIVEPAGFDDYARSLRGQAIVANAATSGSICDGLLAPSPGPIGFALNRQNVGEAATVTDSEALAAVAYAFRELKLVLEPSGAVALAAVLTGRLAVRDRTVAVVLSGANIDAATLTAALAA